MTDSNLQLKNKVIPIKLQSQVIFKDIIGHGSAMRRIFRTVEKVADCDTTIMLNGETGTGKGLIARAIHRASGRKDKPFIQINCGATPEGLLESEFFGYRRGAFTGATTDKAGKFEIANGGTLFLDEIGDMPLKMQVNLLRVIADRTIVKIGGTKQIPVDVRLIAATNQNLQEAIGGENYEYTEMYPGFIDQAKKEGNAEAERSFDLANKVEQIHHKLFHEALNGLEADKPAGDAPYYVCQVCGYTVEGDAPERCPVCGAPRARFKKVD